MVIKCNFFQLFLNNLFVFLYSFTLYSEDLWGGFSNCDVRLLVQPSLIMPSTRNILLFICLFILIFVIAPSSLRFEPVGRWYEANIHRRQHGLSSHHSSSSASSSASSEGGYSSDEEDHRFLLTLDPTDWKVEC